LLLEGYRLFRDTNKGYTHPSGHTPKDGLSFVLRIQTMETTL